MAIWDDVLSGTDRKVYEYWMANTARHEKELGHRPAIIVVDVNYGFVGLKPEPILESIKTYRSSCGEAGWEGVARIRELLALGREVGVPIIYSTTYNDLWRGSGWANRARQPSQRELLSREERRKRELGNTIVKEIEPRPQEIVITKRAPSVFDGTPLLGYLNELDIDTLLVTGTTTSGCVRATVVDAASHRYYVGIVEECVFDRFVISHKVSLMDMHAKYGSVISLGEALEYLKTQAQPALGKKELSTV